MLDEIRLLPQSKVSVVVKQTDSGEILTYPLIASRAKQDIALPNLVLETRGTTSFPRNTSSTVPSLFSRNKLQVFESLEVFQALEHTQHRLFVVAIVVFMGCAKSEFRRQTEELNITGTKRARH